MGFNLPDHLVQVIGDNQASAYKKIIHPGIQGQFQEGSRFGSIYFIGVDKQGEGLTPRFFF